MRRATIKRNTSETKIKLSLALDGKGRYDVSTGIRFLDHMLELLSRHGLFDLKIKAVGDLDVDHHRHERIAEGTSSSKSAERRAPSADPQLNT